MPRTNCNTDEIDMIEIARTILGIPSATVQHPPIDMGETRLYRFNDDGLHVLIDGAGGYEAHIKPHEQDHLIESGHLSDICPK